MSKVRINPIPCKICGTLFSERSYRRYNCDLHYRKKRPEIEAERIRKISESKKGVKRPAFHKTWIENLRKSARRGDKSYRWKGSINPINDTIKKSAKYIEWRKAVFGRDSHTCLLCGHKGGDLNAHHIYSFSQHEHLRFNLGNGVTLCVKCHRKQHVNT